MQYSGICAGVYLPHLGYGLKTKPLYCLGSQRSRTVRGGRREFFLVSQNDKTNFLKDIPKQSLL